MLGTMLAAVAMLPIAISWVAVVTSCSWLIVRLVALVLGGALLLAFLKVRTSLRRRDTERVTLGIYHPFCNDCGGGERVLWFAIKVLEGLKIARPLHIVIYTVDNSPRELIFRNARDKFGIEFSDEFRKTIDFCFVDGRSWLDPKSYPVATMVGQALGAVYLSYKCLNAVVPDIFLDTQGSAFTYLLPHYFSHCCILSYTHYPMISSEMIEKVRSRYEDFNNRSFIAGTGLGTLMKLAYYRLFLKVYQWAGSCSDGIMCNGSWTKGHIDRLFSLKQSWRLFPPCDVSFFLKSHVDVRSAKHIISIGQFRPEKDHNKQLEILSLLLHHTKTAEGDPDSSTSAGSNRFHHVPSDLKLIIVGGARNEDDQERVTQLRKRADALGIAENVQFEVNVSSRDHRVQVGVDRVQELMSQSLVGLHTMRYEHFGISVVELQAAGLVTVAHRSAGPKLDIIEEGKTGFLCNTSEEYAARIDGIFDMRAREAERLEALQEAARASCARFSQEAFGVEFAKVISPFLERYASS